MTSNHEEYSNDFEMFSMYLCRKSNKGTWGN